MTRDAACVITYMTHGSSLGENSMNYTKGGFPVWDDAFDKEHFTVEEIAESDMRAAAAANAETASSAKRENMVKFLMEK